MSKTSEYGFSITGTFTYTYKVSADSPEEAERIATKYKEHWDYAEPKSLEPTPDHIDLLNCQDNVWESGPDLELHFDN